ncbi:MAG: dihydropteroate synthase [Thermaerobacter sp.]|nr:dihydropteroate synthase [Thermaerobacter sp.]
MIIAERINPTGRKKFAEALLAGRMDLVREEALRQVAAGAELLDVNVGVAGIDEPAVLREAVQTVMAAVDVPLCLDSSNPQALAAALEVYEGKPLVNSVTAEDSSLEEILPLVARYHAAVVALPHDEHGISPEPAERVRLASRILERAASLGVPAEDVVVDGLAMAVSADGTAGRITLETLRRLRDDLGVATTLGASNVSFGLPDRPILNLTFMAMAVFNGLTAPIADPLLPGLRRLCRAADLFLERDEWAMRYLEDYRGFPPA